MARRLIRTAVFLIIPGLLISGCVSGRSSRMAGAGIGAKSYARATIESRDKLNADLRGGLLKRGMSLDYVRSEYGDADNMLVSDFGTRLVYRNSSENNKTVLWFDDGIYLSAWAN